MCPQPQPPLDVECDQMPKQIRSVTRALSVIEALSDACSALSLNQLHQITALDRATLLRILATLMESGWVYRSLGDQNYRLSYQIYELGTHVRPQNSLAHLAAPVMDELQKTLIWPSDLSICNGSRMEIIETTRRQSPLFSNHGFVGYQPNMLQSAAGRAYLAWSHPDDQASILRRLQQGEDTEARLACDDEWVQTMLKATRERGYGARDPLYKGGPDDSDHYEVCASAVPILAMDEVQACINLIWLEAFVSPEQLENELLPELRQAASQIAELILEHKLY